MYMMYVWEKMMCDVIVESSKNEVGNTTIGMHVVGAFDLIHEPRRLYVSVMR
jgi:hypothetical protein